MLRPTLAPVIVLLVAHSPAQAHAPELDRLLARPVSPGSVAALVAHAADPGAQARLKAALHDSRPETREAAARVAFVTRSLLLLADTEAALNGETDDGAAAEMVRFLASFGTAEQLQALMTSIGPARSADVRMTFAETLARVHPDLLATYVAGIDESAGFNPAAALVLASAQYPERRTVLARAAMAAGPRTLREYLSDMHLQAVPLEGAFVTEALSAPDGDIRRAAAFYVAMLAGHREDKLDPSAVVAAADGADAAGGATSGWEGAYRELARRVLGRERRPIDWEPLFAGVPPELRWSRVAHVNASLYGPERPTVERLVGGQLPGDEWFRSAASNDHPESRVQTTRTLSASVARLLPDLVSVFGCRPDQGKAFAAAEVFYTIEGRPRVVRPGESRLSSECTAAAHTAFQLTIAPPSLVVGLKASDGVFLPFSPTYLGCVAQPFDRSTVPKKNARQTPPRPKRPLSPDYPKELKRYGVTGRIVVRAEITSRGCARAAETTSSLHPLLDVAMLRAVLEMPYEPSTSDGVPALAAMEIGWTAKP